MAYFKLDLLTFAESASDINRDVNFNCAHYLLSPISEFDNNKTCGSFCYTYDESLSLHQNAQKELSFKFNENIFYHDEWIKNPYLKTLVVGAQLLLTDKDNNQYLFIIKSIKSEFKSLNTIYTVTCQDSFSYQTSRQNSGYSITNDSESDDFIGAKSLDWWAKKICKECKVVYHYLPLQQGLYLDKNKHNQTFTSEDALIKKDVLKVIKPLYSSAIYPELFTTFPFSTSSASAASALISAAETVGMQIETYEQVFEDTRTHLTYISRYFWFKPLKDNINGISGYIYNPRKDIQDFNLSFNGENLTSILNVEGKTNSNDELISLLPELTPFFANVFSSNYWKKSQYYKGFYSQLCHGYTFVINQTNLNDYFNGTFSMTDDNTSKIFWLKKQAFKNVLEDLVSLYDMVSFSQSGSIFSTITLSNNQKSTSTWSNWQIVINEEGTPAKVITDKSNFYRADESLPVQVLWGNSSAEIGIYVPNVLEFDTIIDCQIYLYLYREATQEDIAFARIADNCPWLENKIMAFDYFKNKGIISKSQLINLKDTITNELRKINSSLLLYSSEYYSAIHKKTKILADLLSKLDSLGAAAESDFITPYATTGSLSSTIDNHSYFDAAYKLLFRTNSSLESSQKDSLADYDDLITQYNTLYFNSKQRFLKNLYNFRKYFDSPNTRFAGRSIRILNINLDRANLIDTAGITNWIGFSSSNTSTLTAATKQNIMLDESESPNFVMYKKTENEDGSDKYEKLTIVDKKNVSQFYQLSDLQKGLKQITWSNGRNLTYQKGATYWAYIKDNKYDKWYTKDTEGVTAHQVLPIAYCNSAQDYGIGDAWNVMHKNDIYQRDKVNTYSSVNEFSNITDLKTRITNLYSPRLFGNYSHLTNRMKSLMDKDGVLTWEKMTQEDVVNSYVWNLPITNLYYHTTDNSGYKQLPWLTIDNYDSYYKYTSNSAATTGSLVGAGVLGVGALAFWAATAVIPVAGVIVASTYLIGAAVLGCVSNFYGQQTLNLTGTNKQTLDCYQSIATDTYNPSVQGNIYCITDKDKKDEVLAACQKYDTVKDKYQDILKYLVPGYTTFKKENSAAWGKIGNAVLNSRDNIYFKDKWMRLVDLNNEKINSQDKYYLITLAYTNADSYPRETDEQLVHKGNVLSNTCSFSDIPIYFSQILDYPLMSAAIQVEFNPSFIKKYNGDGFKILKHDYYDIQEYNYQQGGGERVPVYVGECELTGIDSSTQKKVNLYLDEDGNLSQDASQGYHRQKQIFLICREEDYRQILDLEKFKPGLDVYSRETNEKIDYTKVGDGALVGLYQLSEVPDDTSSTATWDNSQQTSYWTKTDNDKFEQVYTAQQILNGQAGFTAYVFNNYSYNTKQFFEGDNSTLEFSVPATYYSTTIEKNADGAITSISNQQQLANNNITLVLTYDKDKQQYCLSEKNNPDNKQIIIPGKPLSGVYNEFTLTRTINNITYTSAFNCNITVEGNSDEIPYMTNGELWYQYHSAYDEDDSAAETKEYLRPLFEYAAAIETQLESYWTSAYGASKYCEYFLPEHWQPWSDKEKNYFSPQILILNSQGLTLSERYVPKIRMLSVNGNSNLSSYQMTYYSNLQDFYDSIAGGDYSGKLINDDEDSITDSCKRAVTTNIVYNEQKEFFDNILGDGYFNNHFIFVKNGNASYYSAVSGGCTWQNLISTLLPAEAQIYSDFNGIYPMLLKVFLTQYKNNSLYLYKQGLCEHDALWQYLYNTYPGIMLEGTYSNEDATTSEELYAFADNYFKQYCQPERNYDVSVIDVLNLKGYDISKPLLQIGNAIQLDPNDYEQDPDNSIYDGLKQYLFISDISYTLRKDNDIKLTVNDIKYEDKLIKSLAKLIK